MKERKTRVEDALSATRAAVEEGVVAGGGVTYLGSSGGDECSANVAYGINNAGVVVGQAIQGCATLYAFRWESGVGMQNLNDLIDPASGWVLLYAKDINSLGQIVGFGWLNGQGRAFLLTPGSGGLHQPSDAGH